jgi:hypothetical protein
LPRSTRGCPCACGPQAACLDTVGKFSLAAKADGYVVTLVPPESYYDITTGLFDLSLLHAYPEGPASFKYHGHSAYAYLQSRYGGSARTPTFDLVMIQVCASRARVHSECGGGAHTHSRGSQLYETYSHAHFNITSLGQSAEDYLSAWIPRVYDGWAVEFSSCPDVAWASAVVVTPQSQVVVGLANGWADSARSLLIWPADVGTAYSRLAAAGRAPRGFMFWDISDEGAVPKGFSQPLWMAKGLNAFMHVRSE